MMPFNAARATTVAGEGWNVTKTFVRGATSFYDGTKSIVLNGKDYAVKGSAFITPHAGQVAKMIVRTGAVLAVDLAIKALIGGIEYVLDPANSQVIYHGDPNGTFYWDQKRNLYFSSVKDACIYAANNGNYSKYKFYSIEQNGSTQWVCKGKELKPDGTEYDPKLPPANYALINGEAIPGEEKHLPYETVANQVISDANSDNANAKAYVSSVADTALEDDETKQFVPATDIINQLEYNQSIPTTETAQGQSTPQADPKDPTAPKAPPTDIKLDFPVFCGWAPTVCQAAQSAIEFPKTAKNWWDTSSKAISGAWGDVKDWVKDPENTDNNLDLDDQSQPEPNTQINFSTSCPAKIPLNFSWNGQSLDFSFDFSIWCESISTFVYPIVVALGALHALYIVSGVREDG